MNVLNKLAIVALKETSRHLVTSLYYTDRYYQYRKINSYLYRLCKEKYNKYRSPGTDAVYHELMAKIWYTIVFDRFNFMVVSTEDVKAGDDILRAIRLDFVGPDRYKYKEKFIKKAFRKENTISVQMISAHPRDDVYMDIVPHDFNDIVLQLEDKMKIINGITKWNKDKPWYDKHHLPHKIGVLLYGEPGTGKSTIVRAISHMLGNCDILTIGSSEILNAMSILSDRKTHSSEPIVLLLEDIDMLFGDRAATDSEEETGVPKVTWRQMESQRVLFQLLDGVWSPDNVVIVATTNYYDRLDEALIRHSRFSIQVELHNFDREAALEMVKNFELTEEFLDGLGLTYPVQPAYLQDLIIEHRAKEDL